jgi:L-ascorbate metabolism protein UlaG (beta-lactamase superfamily)
VLTNGAAAELLGLKVEAVPAYNRTSTFHPKGVGNGYVVTIGGKRLYVSGDTEDVPEIRALRDIDVAVVCMNLPYTMTVAQAASAVRELRPAVVYPYHSQGSDLNQFKRLAGADLGIEVRLRKWY